MKRERWLILIAFVLSLVYLWAMVPKAHSLDMIDPMDNAVVTSGPGLRVNPMGGSDYQLHRGTDYVAPHQAPVKATALGRVVGFWLDHDKFGGLVILQHAEGIMTLSAHMSKLNVKLHQIVQQGDIIGWQGNTGISTGPHLHYEIITDPAYRRQDVKEVETTLEESYPY